MAKKLRWFNAMCAIGWVMLSIGSAPVRAENPPMDDPDAVKKLLETKLPIFQRDKMTPGEATRLVASLANANIYLDSGALESAGYDLKEKNVFLSAQNITLATTLDRLVKTISTPKAPLIWQQEAGVIVISTEADKNWRAIPIAADKNSKEPAFRDDRVIDEFNFDDVALRDATSLLRDNNMNVYYHWAALDTVGIDLHNRVDITLKRVRPRTAIQMLVREMAGPQARVSFAVRDGVWIISTPADLEKQTHAIDWRPQHIKDQATADKMAQWVEDIGFNATPLGDAFDTISRTGEISMDIDWPSLAKAKIDRTTPVSLNVRHVKLSTVIDLVLCEAGGVDNELDYTGKDTTITVTLKPPPATKPTTKPAMKVIKRTVVVPAK